MQNPDQQAVPKRLIELDILRGVAVLLVLGRHVLQIPEVLPPFIAGIFGVWREAGWIGVDLFFVLSGFLVSGLLFNEYQKSGKLRIGRFLVRRGFKIYPSFYFFLLVTIVTSYFFEIPTQLNSRIVVGELFFLQNYVGHIWGHTWSLAVEEQFYLLLAFFMVCLLGIRKGDQNPFQSIPKYFYVTAIVILAARIITSYKFPSGESGGIFTFTHLRIDSLFFGVLLSYFYHFKQSSLAVYMSRFKLPLLLLCCLTFALPLLFPLTGGRFVYTFGFTLLYLGFGALLLLCITLQSNFKDQIIQYSRLLSWIGQASYSIYLWHMMVYRVSALIFSPDSDTASFYLQISLYLVGSVLFGALAAKIIEFPMLRIRERYFP